MRVVRRVKTDNGSVEDAGGLCSGSARSATSPWQLRLPNAASVGALFPRCSVLRGFSANKSGSGPVHTVGTGGLIGGPRDALRVEVR